MMKLPTVDIDPYADDYTKAFTKGRQSMLEEVKEFLVAYGEELDQLKAQVEQLRGAYKDLSGAINDLDDCESDSQDYFEASAKVFVVMQYHYNHTLRFTPAQCLAEIKAQAGRDGYFEGYTDALNIQFSNLGEELAEEYANQLRQQVKVSG